MSDDPQRYRDRPDHASVDRRVTVLEVELRNLGRNVSTHVQSEAEERRDIRALLERLDQRADHTDVVMARVLAGLALAGFLGQLFAPIIRTAIFGNP